MTDSKEEALAPSAESAPPPPQSQPSAEIQSQPSDSEKDQAPEPWHSEWFPDLAEPLEKQNVCTRLLCFPCQCGAALCHSCNEMDCGGVLAVFCCSPCGACCCCPNSKQKSINPHGEPEEFPYENAGEQGVEITYEQIFEMEQKRRQLLKATIN